MYAFDYHSAASAKDAGKLLAKFSEAKLLAGGQTLLPTMKNRLASPAHLIDLGSATDMASIAAASGKLTIGAMVTHARVSTDLTVRQEIPGLADLAGGIGDPQVRHRGTIGGSIANNDPSADYPAAILALDATIVTTKRRIGSDAYFQGIFTTALEPEEIITAIAFPKPQRFAYAKFANPASRYALVGVAVALSGRKARVAITGAGSDGVFRWLEAEERLTKSFAVGSLSGLAVEATGLNSDLHASAGYRANLVQVMTERAVESALAQTESWS